MILCTIHQLNEEDKEFLNRLVEEDVHFCRHFNQSTIDLNDVTILISYGYDFTEEDLQSMPNLQWVHIFQSGYEHLNLDTFTTRSIQVTNTTDFHSIPISEYVLSMILNSARNFVSFYESQRAALWDRRNHPPATEAFEKTVAIFGTGTIGQKIAQRLQTMEMKTIGINTSGAMRPYFDEVYQMKDKLEVLKRSDFVVLILPDTPATKNCIDAEAFEAMPNHCYVVNVGRGPLINNDDLVQAILQKKIKGAALDVFHIEPLPRDHILWELPRVLITPHIASITDQYAIRGFGRFIEDYKRFKKGLPMKQSITPLH